MTDPRERHREHLDKAIRGYNQVQERQKHLELLQSPRGHWAFAIRVVFLPCPQSSVLHAVYGVQGEVKSTVRSVWSVNKDRDDEELVDAGTPH